LGPKSEEKPGTVGPGCLFTTLKTDRESIRKKSWRNGQQKTQDEEGGLSVYGTDPKEAQKKLRCKGAKHGGYTGERESVVEENLLKVYG